MTHSDGPPRGLVHWLRGEVARWQAEGTITPEQAAAILARYPDDEPTGNRTATVFTALGAVLLGVGALLFVAANWQRMDTAVKLALIFGSMLASHGLGWWLGWSKQTYPRLGHALVWLGTLLYGAGIWLVAQIFHLNAHWPNGVLFWALGALPVAWAAESRLNLALGVLLLCFWTGSEQLNFSQSNFLFLPLLAMAVALAYRLKAPESLFFGAGGLVLWQMASMFHWLEHVEEAAIAPAFSALTLLGLALFALAPWHESDDRLRPLAWPYHIAGALAGLAGLYLQTFRWDWHRAAVYPVQSWLVLGVMTLLGLAAAVQALRRGGPDARPVAMTVAAGALALPATVVGLGAGTARYVTFNALMLAAVVGLVAYGYRQRSEALVNLALGGFLLLVITRYFDWFYSLMNRSLFFMLGGLLLLAGGFLLERLRRNLRHGGVRA